jgi:hypothetical protein
MRLNSLNIKSVIFASILILQNICFAAQMSLESKKIDRMTSEQEMLSNKLDKYEKVIEIMSQKLDEVDKEKLQLPEKKALSEEPLKSKENEVDFELAFIVLSSIAFMCIGLVLAKITLNAKTKIERKPSRFASMRETAIEFRFFKEELSKFFKDSIHMKKESDNLSKETKIELRKYILGSWILNEATSSEVSELADEAVESVIGTFPEEKRTPRNRALLKEAALDVLVAEN